MTELVSKTGENYKDFYEENREIIEGSKAFVSQFVECKENGGKWQELITLNFEDLGFVSASVGGDGVLSIRATSQWIRGKGNVSFGLKFSSPELVMEFLNKLGESKKVCDSAGQDFKRAVKSGEMGVSPEEMVLTEAERAKDTDSSEVVDTGFPTDLHSVYGKWVLHTNAEYVYPSDSGERSSMGCSYSDFDLNDPIIVNDPIGVVVNMGKIGYSAALERIVRLPPRIVMVISEFVNSSGFTNEVEKPEGFIHGEIDITEDIGLLSDALLDAYNFMKRGNQI